MIEIHDCFDGSTTLVDPTNHEQMAALDNSERSLVEMVVLLNDVVTTGSMIAYYAKQASQRPFTATTNSTNPPTQSSRRYWIT